MVFFSPVTKAKGLHTWKMLGAIDMPSSWITPARVFVWPVWQMGLRGVRGLPPAVWSQGLCLFQSSSLPCWNLISGIRDSLQKHCSLFLLILLLSSIFPSFQQVTSKQNSAPWPNTFELIFKFNNLPRCLVNFSSRYCTFSWASVLYTIKFPRTQD
jgi:hypothetical protein